MVRPCLSVLAIVISLTVAAQDQYPTKGIEPFYDLSFTDAERDSLKGNLENLQKDLQELHKYKMDNSVGMSLKFDPRPRGFKMPGNMVQVDKWLPKEVSMPANKEELAFYPVYKLAVLIKSPGR
jgi:hypothetical protein